MKSDEFGTFAPMLISAGARVLGGCCGTTPDHIASLKNAIAADVAPVSFAPARHAVSSARDICETGVSAPFVVVGERINPTGKKALRESLREGRLDIVLEFAEQQEQTGAKILDVNLGVSGIDEPEMMRRTVRALAGRTRLPLCIDTTNPDAAEAALREYPGRAVFNSISLESDRIQKMLPRVAAYGPMLVILPVTDEGVPETAAERIDVIRRIFAETEKYGYTKDDICVDALALTVATNPAAAVETLKVIRWCSQEWGVNVICGLSNISHGLPRRDIINREFLGMAMGQGLNMAIANPMQTGIMEAVAAGDMLKGRDGAMNDFLAAFSGTDATPAASASSAPVSPEDALRHALLSGDAQGITPRIQALLDAGAQPGHIVDDILIPGISEVGDRFEKKQYFLPQLMNSAEALKTAMAFLTPFIENAGNAPAVKRGKILLATVRYDIHDIGKNIVAMMLRNYNFDVIDLGKDVPAEDILDAAVRENITVIGLSALMTTTMKQMKVVVNLARERGLDHIRFIVGGAAVDPQFASEIGAFYSADAMETVKIAEKLLC